ncbi:MAG: hypothetical protein SVK08_01870 [Halobacteriota archaeon]|nr:hypothetical protein [Halobacteriota archaeon]
MEEKISLMIQELRTTDDPDASGFLTSNGVIIITKKELEHKVDELVDKYIVQEDSLEV